MGVRNFGNYPSTHTSMICKPGPFHYTSLNLLYYFISPSRRMIREKDPRTATLPKRHEVT